MYLCITAPLSIACSSVLQRLIKAWEELTENIAKYTHTSRYQLHVTMKEVGSFYEFLYCESIANGKHGWFLIVCPVERLYLSVNVHGCKR